MVHVSGSVKNVEIVEFLQALKADLSQLLQVMCDDLKAHCTSHSGLGRKASAAGLGRWLAMR